MNDKRGKYDRRLARIDLLSLNDLLQVRADLEKKQAESTEKWRAKKKEKLALEKKARK